MADEWKFMYKHSGRFSREEKTGLTQAIWNSVHPSKKQSEEALKYEMVRRVCGTVNV